jgi:acetyl esterase/lipase
MPHASKSRLFLFSVLCFLGSSAAALPAAEPSPHSIKTHADIEFAKPDGVALLLDLHLPADVKSPPLVLFIHGGGWRQGDRKKNKLDWLPAHGFAVASIEYRLSSEGVFPAQIHDCHTALRWLRAHADDYGYDASRIVVAGASAGGHLAALLGLGNGVAALEGDADAAASAASSRIVGVIDYYGATDLIARAVLQPRECEEANGKVYRLLGGKVSENAALARLASPISHVTPDDPPLLILHGELDQTVPISQSELLRDRHRAAGLEARLYVKPGVGHGWTNSDAKERELVLTTLRRWLEKK